MNDPQSPQSLHDDHSDTNEAKLVRQMSGFVQHNIEAKQDKIKRMQAFAQSVIDEFRQGDIKKGVWKLAEEQSISLATLSSWTNDKDWQTLAAQMKLARLLTLEHKVNRAVVNGEGVQLLSNLLGIWNRLDPQAQQVNGVVTHISMVSAVRQAIPDEDRARILASDS